MHFYSIPKTTKLFAAFCHWSQQDLCNWRVGRLGHCADRSSSSRRRRRGWPSWSRSRRIPGKDKPLQRSLPYLSHFLFNVRTLLRPVPVWEKATTVESDWVISFNMIFFLSHSCRNTFFGWGDFLSKLVQKAKKCYHWITCFLPLALLDRTSNVKKLSRILLLKCVKQNPTTPKTLICNFSFLKMTLVLTVAESLSKKSRQGNKKQNRFHFKLVRSIFSKKLKLFVKNLFLLKQTNEK